MPLGRRGRQSPFPPPPIRRGGLVHPPGAAEEFLRRFAAGAARRASRPGLFRGPRGPSCRKDPAPLGRRAGHRAGRLAQGPAAARPRRAGRRRRRRRPGRNVQNGARTVARSAGDMAGFGRLRPLERPEKGDRGGGGGARRAGVRDPFTEFIDVSLRGRGRRRGRRPGPAGSRPDAKGTPEPEVWARRADRGAGGGVLNGQGEPRRTKLGRRSDRPRGRRIRPGAPLAARTRWGGSARAGFPPRSAGACRRGPGGLSSVGGPGQAPTANSTTWAASAIWACSSTLRAMLSRTSWVHGHRPAQIARRSSPDLPITSGVKSRPL